MAKSVSLSLHTKQMEVYQSKARFRVVVAGRRWGKCVKNGTLITMSDGSFKKVENIVTGDSVLTVNENTYKIESKKVQHLQDNGVKETLKVTLRSGKSLEITPNHPLLANNKWTEVRHLKIGDLIAVPKSTLFGDKEMPDHEVDMLAIWLADGDIAWEEIISIEDAGKNQTYDLSIEGNHNFIANGIVTHNSQLSKVLMIRWAQVKKRKIWYVAPTYKMAKQIMWVDLLDAIPRKWIRKVNETALTVTLINGTRIELKGADKADSLRGVGIHFLVLDEFQDMSEEVWTRVLRPTLADTGGHVIFIGTPKAFNYLYELYKHGQNPLKPQWASWQFPTITSPFIPESEIEDARNDMDEKSFKQEFEASFESMSGRVYYPFDRNSHVGSYAFNSKLPIWVGMDFNVDPMSTVIYQPQENGELWAVDEIVLFGSNTEEVCEELEKRFWREQSQVVIYPDPAGGQRQHARGETDMDILREKGFKRVKYRRKHPLVADRVNAVNRMLRDANGKIRLRVDSKCKHFITALEQTIYKKGSREVDKTAGIEHSADAGGYCIEIEFPVRRVEIGGLSI